MIEDKFNRGCEIKEILNQLYSEKAKWEKANHFFMIKLSEIKPGYFDCWNVDTSLLDFEEIKVHVLCKLNTKIGELIKEFRDL